MENESVNSTNPPLSGRMDLQGHRGARGARPENTLPAFIYCVEHHMTTIELDTHMTRDKQLIIYHDSRINRKLCLDEQGRPAAEIPVQDLTVAQLKRLDCGALKNDEFPEQTPVKNTRMMTLAELFLYARRHESENPRWKKIRFNIEMKFPQRHTRTEIAEAARILIETIEEAEMVDRVTVQSFVTDVLPEIRTRNETVGLSALFQPTRLQGIKMMFGLNANRHQIIEKTLETGADTVSPYHLYANRAFVRKCHGKNLRVVPWTVNETKIMLRLFENGVNGMISDYPERLNNAYEIYKSRGKD